MGFEFAISGIDLAGAGRWMIGHQKFEDGLARVENFFGIGGDLHAGFDRANEGSGEDAGTGFDAAEAADTYGSFVLEMAERGDGDAVDARGVEDGGARGEADGLAVDVDFDAKRGCGRGAPGYCL